MDDAQFIGGKKATQEELLNTFDELYSKGCSIVLAMDRAPNELCTLEDRIRSRFEGGLVVQIQEPEYETRLQIVKNKAAERDLCLKDEDMIFIAENITRSVRRIEGILNYLNIKVRTEGTFGSIRDTVSEIFASKPASLTPDALINGVCIIGYKDYTGNPVIESNAQSINIKDLGTCVDYDAKTVDLHAVTTDVALLHIRASTYQVSDKGFLEQSLDSKGTKYDFAAVDECIDIAALKALGYANATISIECDIRAESGKQQIIVLRDWPETEKRVKDVTLFDSGKIDYANSDESYKGSITVPIDEIGPSIYVAYTAHGLPIKSNGWKSNGLELVVSFSK